MLDNKHLKGKYKTVTEWSEEDNAFMVSLPDFNVMQPCTHGESYQEALDNAQDVIELLEDVYDQKGIALPVSSFVA